MTFAIITPALIAGAFADRMKFSALVLFMVLWLILVYCPIAHWVWGGGWLGHARRARLRRRHGRAYQCRHRGPRLRSRARQALRATASENMAPHNLVYSVIGASLLWVGWFGFNAGSAVTADGQRRHGHGRDPDRHGRGGPCLDVLPNGSSHKKPSVLGIISGAVAGLVAITPASGFVDPIGALIDRRRGRCRLLSSRRYHVKQALGYDDSLDAFGVHAVGGIIGRLLTGVLRLERNRRRLGLLT